MILFLRTEFPGKPLKFLIKIRQEIFAGWWGFPRVQSGLNQSPLTAVASGQFHQLTEA